MTHSTLPPEYIGNEGGSVLTASDLIIGLSSGPEWGIDSLNWRLANLANQQAEARQIPIIGDAIFVQANPLHTRSPIVHNLEAGFNPLASRLPGEVRCRTLLLRAQSFMTEAGFNRPMLITRRRDVNQVLKAATSIGMALVAAADLPDSTDPDRMTAWQTIRSLSRTIFGRTIL